MSNIDNGLLLGIGLGLLAAALLQLLDRPAPSGSIDEWAHIIVAQRLGRCSEILGIEHYNVPLQELKAAYAHKARETHPDVGGSAERFIEIQKAYEFILLMREDT